MEYLKIVLKNSSKRQQHKWIVGWKKNERFEVEFFFDNEEEIS